MPPTPEGLIDRPQLKQLAGDDIFARGEAYLAEGRVRQLQAANDRAVARVEGSRTYRVKLWKRRGELQFSCDCPMGAEHTFCKHVVALGLAWVSAAEALDAKPEEQPARSIDREAARKRLDHYVQTLDRERLLKLVLEATDYDDILRRRLLLEAAGVSRPDKSMRTSDRPAPDLEAYSRLLREAIDTGDYVDYDAMPDYAQGVQEAVQPLGQLLRDGFAPAVVELTEFALLELDKVSDLLDGSDGSLNAVYDDLQRYHLEACALAEPNPEALAARLLEYEIEGGLGIFNNALKAYADVLGSAGVAAWRRMLKQQWSELPATVALPKDGSGKRAPIDHRRFQLQTLMERAAEAEGDTGTLIAIKEADLSSAHDYLALAALLEKAGRPADALARAEQGLRMFPTPDDSAGLRDFLIDAYERVGRSADARALLWDAFQLHGDAEHYRRLRTHVPNQEWPAWRERALTALRARVAAASEPARKFGWSRALDHSALVEILLEENLPDEAWKEAQAGGCRVDLWLQLAAMRTEKHPADALRIYQSRLEPTIALGGPNAYREAIELLDQIRALLGRLGRSEDFAPYRAEIRAAHRGKRNFLKLLDAAGR